LEPKLREGEVAVKTLGEGWHAVCHGNKFQWSKTMYRSKLYRNSVLTNQRLVLLKDSEIDYEVSLENIVKAVPKKVLWHQPYLKLELKDGNTVIVVFESVVQRIVGGIGGSGLGDTLEAERIAKEWAAEINLQIKSLKQRQILEAKPTPPPPPPMTTIVKCPTCGQPLTFIQQYGRWYCYKCQKYP